MSRKLTTVVIPILIAAGIMIYMLYRVWDDLIAALEHLIPVYLFLAVIVCLAAWWFRGLRYRWILGSLMIPVSIAFSTACIFVSQTANLIVPARLGDLVRVLVLRQAKGATVSAGISSIVVERVFDVLTVALLGLISLTFVLHVPDWFYTAIILPIVIGVVFFAFLLFADRIKSENRYLRIILTMLEQIRQASLSVRSLVFLTVISIVIWLSDMVVCQFVVLMFGEQIPFALIALAIVIGNLVKAIPITPGGVGTYELAMVATFSLAGVAPSVATLIAVIDHLIKNLVTLGGGAVSIHYLGNWVLPSIRKALNRELADGDQPGN